MTIQISALGAVPESAQGYVKDFRVRWALEEAGIPYETHLIGFDLPMDDPYREWQPFGQVPALREGDVEMFESGAIVLRIAERSDNLFPRADRDRARAVTWVFAAVTTLQPHIDNLNHLGGEVPAETRARLLRHVESRLAALERRLAASDWLERHFTAGDLMMCTVLREVDENLLARFPALSAYVARCEARPAFGRAMEAHLAPFRAAAVAD